MRFIVQWQVITQLNKERGDCASFLLYKRRHHES